MKGSEILHGDSMELLPGIPSESVDMVLTDPPYGLTNCAWDKVPPLVELMKQLLRIAKPNGAIVLTAQQPFTTDLINAARRHFRYDLIWEKPWVTGHLHAKQMPMRCHEHVLVFYKSLPTYNPQHTAATRLGYSSAGRVVRQKDSNYKFSKTSFVSQWSEAGTRLPGSVIKSGAKISHSERLHPTQKPSSLFEWLIKTYTNPGEHVLDPFAGSGTTVEACWRTSRTYTVIERDEKFFGAINKRLAALEYGGTQMPLDYTLITENPTMQRVVAG